MAIRQRDGESATSTQGNDRSRSIAFIANVPPKDIPPLGGVDGLPTIGADTHPDDATLLARSLSVQPLGPAQSRVTVTYATQRFGGGTLARSTVDISGNRFTYSASFELVNVEIPYAVLEEVEINSGDTSSTVTLWRSDTIEVQESRLVVAVTYERVGMSLATMRTFNAQNNKIHSFAGSDWLFTVGSIRPIDNTSNVSGIFEVNVTWTEDLGTSVELVSEANIKYPGGANGLAYLGDAPGGTLIRSPYTSLGIVTSDAPADGSANNVPVVFQYPTATPDPNGYQSLGLPPGAIS